MVSSLIGMSGAEIIPIKGLQQDLTPALTAQYFHFDGGLPLDPGRNARRGLARADLPRCEVWRRPRASTPSGAR